MTQPQARTLSKVERTHLDALAGEFAFWRDVRDRAAADWDGSLTAGQYARLVEAIVKYPSILCGKPVRNRRGKDGAVHCWRSKADGCRAVATHVVDRVGVCSAHVDVQQADAQRYAASHPPKPKPQPQVIETPQPAPPADPEEQRARANQAIKNLASLLDPVDEGPGGWPAA